MDNQPRNSEDKKQAPCPLCGGTSFRWGRVGTGNPVPQFIEDDVPPGFFSRPRIVPLVARECSDCGNVQWFTQSN